MDRIMVNCSLNSLASMHAVVTKAKSCSNLADIHSESYSAKSGSTFASLWCIFSINILHRRRHLNSRVTLSSWEEFERWLTYVYLGFVASAALSAWIDSSSHRFSRGGFRRSQQVWDIVVSWSLNRQIKSLRRENHDTSSHEDISPESAFILVRVHNYDFVAVYMHIKLRYVVFDFRWTS